MTAPAPPLPPGEGPSLVEGAGLVSSLGDLGDVDNGFQFAFAAAAIALDALGFVANPFESLVSAGVGWAFEHLAILSEPLDRLTGNPWEIKAEAQSWHVVALGLAEAAAVQRELAGPRSTGWTGEAGDAYRLAAGIRAEQIAVMAVQTDEFAVELIRAGARVGALRSIVRDLVADLVGEVVGWAVGGAMAAALTGGASLVAAAGWMIIRVIDLARDIARRIGDLLQALADAGHAAGGLASGMLDAARASRVVAFDLHRRALPHDDPVSNSPIGELVEIGKQSHDATLEDPEPTS
jgi:hypothetical protein